jgi:hypothetical protein
MIDKYENQQVAETSDADLQVGYDQNNAATPGTSPFWSEQVIATHITSCPWQFLAIHMTSTIFQCSFSNILWKTKWQQHTDTPLYLAAEHSSCVGLHSKTELLQKHDSE